MIYLKNKKKFERIENEDVNINMITWRLKKKMKIKKLEHNTGCWKVQIFKYSF